jgi:hypothetical protein
MKQIPLSNGKFALVDEEDYYRVMSYKWIAVKLFSDKFYARNQKFGLLSKFLMKSDPNEDFVVDFVNGDTLDYRKQNLVKRKSVIRKQQFELVRRTHQLSLPLNSENSETNEPKKSEFVSGVFEKRVYEAKHIDGSGRIFHFGTFDTPEEAKVSYDRNMKMISD